MNEQWIVIPNWDASIDADGVRHDGFQHYRDRDPIWIKVYTRLHSSDEYLALSFHLRGVLVGLWVEYATANRQLSDSTLTLTRRLGQRVSRRDLVSLSDAGYLTFSASKPLARRYQDASPEKEKEKEQKGARTRKGKAGALIVIDTMIRNGAITDPVHLEAELRAHHIEGQDADQLRQRIEAA